VLNYSALSRKIERQIRRVGLSGKEKKVQVRAHPAVALYLLEEERGTFDQLKREYGIDVEIRDDPLLHRDEFSLVSLPSQRPLKLDLSA
jgi:Ribonuclease G/E